MVMDLLSFSTEVTREAGALLMRYFRRDFNIQLKGRINLVTEADIAAEKLIASRIRARYPSHGLLCEEGHNIAGNSEFLWIVDPLDGTTNFAHGYPCFCVSMGLEHRGELLLGAVFNPISNELFHAVKGEGAFLNGRRLAVSGTETLEGSLLATGFPYDIRSIQENNIDNFSMLALNSRAIRRDGAAALDLCYVAAGWFDGYWELHLSPWDTAAGVLIVEEAGGRVTNIAGGSFNHYKGEMIASNGLIHDEMVKLLNVRRGPPAGTMN
jgi:myo-inositol-1(or 4)-monophosphatase